jgi:nucleotide-binding universal stress UspA family protein
VFQLIVVPVDGSVRAFDAVRHGAAIAAARAIELHVVYVVHDEAQRAVADRELTAGIGRIGKLPAVARQVVLIGAHVAPTLAGYVASTEGATIVMSSTGRGRSAAVLGSVADELLELTSVPLIVVGPNARDPRPLAGDLLVPLDGSSFAAAAVPLAGAWAAAFGARPWLVEVRTVGGPRTVDDDEIESGYVATQARELAARIDRDVEFEVLYGGSPVWAIVDQAERIGAGHIIMTTHGRTGLRRLALGSVAADLVRHAPCPVVLQRPPRVDEAEPADGRAGQRTTATDE